MGFRVTCTSDDLTVALTGWDRVMTWRRDLHVAFRDVGAASVQQRGSLEDAIDHRATGIGTHDGKRRPGRRRVGTMLGRAVKGIQFWAVPASPPTSLLLVLDMNTRPFVRVVLACDHDVTARVTAAVPTT